METLHIDTYIVCWLYEDIPAKVKRFKELFSNSVPLVSSMVELELNFLFEIGRTTQPGDQVIEDLHEAIKLQVSNAPFPRIIRQSLQEAWTRNPFDRIIVANAKIDGVRLVTKDKTILKHFSRAFWS